MDSILELTFDSRSLPTTWMGWLIYFLIPFKRSTAKKNIEKVFYSQLSPSERRRIAVAYYSHILACLKEIIVFALFDRKNLEERIQINGMEHLLNALNKEKGVIVLTGHLGSWEFASLFGVSKLNLPTHRIYCIRKSLRFKFLNHIFWRRFEESEFEVINKNNALLRAHKALKKKGIVLFPFDLKPSGYNESRVTVDFLGQASSTYSSVAFLADRDKCPVISLACYRLNKKQHIIQFYPEIQWHEETTKQQTYIENTKKYNKRMDEMLLAHPEQWLWSYKRWE